MAVHRRQLPIVGPCDGFLPAPGSERGEGGFCERCQREVHDVSSMRESELHALVTAHVGQGVCLSYRVDRRGYVQMRPEPRAMMLGALAVLLAACAGHLQEAEAPGGGCRDPDGYQVECPGWGQADLHAVPDAAVEDEPADGCPVRPTAEAVGDEASIDVPPLEPDDPTAAAEDPAPDVRPETSSDAAPDAAGTDMKYRANFSIDPEHAPRHVVGIVVGWSPLDPRTGRLRFVPTARLWDEWRERRAERKAARDRRRVAARR